MIKTEEAPWLKLAVKEIGVKEIIGVKHNPKIIKYHQSTILKATEDEISWCSAFVCWVIESYGMESTRSAAARSWLNWGEPTKYPYSGCIAVFSRGSEKWMGHVGFYIGETDSHVKVLGGNQGNSVSIREYPKSRLLSYRIPKLVS